MKAPFRVIAALFLVVAVLFLGGLVTRAEVQALTVTASKTFPLSYSWSKVVSSQTTAFATVLPSNPQSTVNNTVPQPIPQDEQWMLSQINRERTSRGIKPLTLDPALVQLARKKSQDIVVNNYFAHESPTYGSPGKMVKDAGIKYWLCGENLARATSVASAHQLLMDSSIHRANILNRNYTHIGIGIVPQKSGRGVVVTQLFIAK